MSSNILIDGEPDYLVGFVFNSDRDEFVDPDYNPKGQFPEHVIVERNKAIVEAWSCPEKRAKQSERASRDYDHSPEIHAKRSKGMKKFIAENPEFMVKVGNRKAEYWARWRAERGLPEVSDQMKYRAALKTKQGSK